MISSTHLVSGLLIASLLGGGGAAGPLTSEGDTDLDPGTIALCNAGFGDVSVKSYDVPVLDHIDMLCGDDASGYVHIRKNHENDWQTLVDKYGGGTNWDDFMEYALAQSVTAPSDGYPIDIGGDKYCYTTPIEIFDRDGNPLATINPTIIVSANNKKIITAVPTTDKVSSNCNAAT